jgi:drug/metabolite transporter (DMT)-like permease
MHARASVTPGSSSNDYVFPHIFLVETFLAMIFGLSQKLGRLLSESIPCNLFFFFLSRSFCFVCLNLDNHLQRGHDPQASERDLIAGGKSSSVCTLDSELIAVNQGKLS